LPSVQRARYISLETIAPLSDDPIVKLQPVAADGARSVSTSERFLVNAEEIRRRTTMKRSNAMLGRFAVVMRRRTRRHCSLESFVIRKMSAKAAAIAAVLFCITANVGHATLIEKNSAFGADTLTLDTKTGLEWLDLNITQDQSYNSVISQLGSTYAGFSVASLSQVSQFYSDAGIASTTGGTGINRSVETLLNLWGMTASIPSDKQYATFAFTSDPDGSIFEAIAGLEQWLDDPGLNQTAGWVAIKEPDNGDYKDVSYPIVGTALVLQSRHHSIPEPGTLAMFGTGLIALLGAVQRRKRNVA
jgi:hypothetical protein